jgi:hypothetical protein
MTSNQNPRSTKRFAVIGYTGSKRSRVICCFLTRNEIITENEKKVNILITFQFYQLLFLFCDKFVDGAQAEVAGDFAGRRHILVTLIVLGVLTWIGGY